MESLERHFCVDNEKGAVGAKTLPLGGMRHRTTEKVGVLPPKRKKILGVLNFKLPSIPKVKRNQSKSLSCIPLSPLLMLSQARVLG